MISPMIEVTGPMGGVTPGGSSPPTVASRSAICWRLR
jgi:hypothetical protein